MKTLHLPTHETFSSNHGVTRTNHDRPTSTRHRPACLMLAAGLLAAGAVTAVAQTTRPGMTPVERGRKLAQAAREMNATQDRIEARLLLQRGVKYLLAAQEADGGWASQTGPGITSLVVKALAQAPRVGPHHPAVRRGVQFVLRFQHEDGGIYTSGGPHKNYETSVALSMLAVLHDKQYEPHIRRARAFLQKLQWDEGEGKSPDDPWYGGAGYGRHKRPDLSNTQMMIEALHDSGLPPDDPTYKKALLFIQRCQMRGESNDQPFARGATQGGFIYSPANGGESKAETTDDGGQRRLRCYGSMTYAGFKSMLYAGLSRNDPRVRAALAWIGRHWTLDHNPNMPTRRSRQGLYYYFHVFGRALAAWGEPVVRDHAGRAHHWRHELVAKLASLQKDDGSWVNDQDRWMEGIPPLTTAYAMLALEAAFPQPAASRPTSAGE